MVIKKVLSKIFLLALNSKKDRRCLMRDQEGRRWKKGNLVDENLEKKLVPKDVEQFRKLSCTTKIQASVTLINGKRRNEKCWLPFSRIIQKYL